MFTNYFLGYVNTKALRGALVVALGATLAALTAVALVATSGTAVGQQQGQEAPPSQGLESSAETGVAPKPEQSTQRDFVPAERVIGLNEGVTNSTQGIEQAAEASGGRVVESLDDPKNRAVLLKFPSEQAALAAAEGLSKRPDVQYVERNGIVEGSAVSSDPDVGLQWHHTVIRRTAADLGTLPSAPPTIAVVDSGVDYNHPDLKDNIWTNPGEVAGNNIDDDNNGYVDDVHGYDFVNGDGDPIDDLGHGTHVAGIAAATAGNGIGVEGVSPNSKILAIKVLSSTNVSTYFNVARGLAYARTAKTTPETNVINASLCADPPEELQLLADEVAAIKAAGKILVSSAHNDNSSATTGGCRYPGSDPNTALRVTATTENDCRARFSNFSPASNPTFYIIAAPGDDIYSTRLNGGYEFRRGTSMASPMVAGAAALVWGKTPILTREEVVNTLVSTGAKTSCGFAAPTRRLDVRKALLGTSETAIIGQLLDPATGRAPGQWTVFGSPPLATAKLFSGNTLLKADETTQYGFYEMTGLTAGTGRTLKATRSGYVSSTLRTGIRIVDGKVTGPSTDALPQARDTGNATVTVDWKTHQPRTDTDGCRDTCNGWDFEIWVTVPEGVTDPNGNPQLFVTSAGVTGSLTSAPFVSAPYQSSTFETPVETAIIGSQAADGIYKVAIWKWAIPEQADYNPFFNGSQASVQMYDGAARLGGGLKRVPSTCGTNQGPGGQWWYVGDLTKIGTSYTWTPKNLCTNSGP